MDYYAGIDVSLKESSVCVVDAAGKVVREVKVASEPEALIWYFDELGLPVSRLRLGRYRSGCMPGSSPPDAMPLCRPKPLALHDTRLPM
jgi:hypothetical protein